MLAKLIRIIFVVVLLVILIEFFPIVLTWFTTAIEWVLSFGKLGVVAIVSCVIIAVLGSVD